MSIVLAQSVACCGALCGKMSNTQRGNLAIVFIPHLLLDGRVYSNGVICQKVGGAKAAGSVTK